MENSAPSYINNAVTAPLVAARPSSTATTGLLMLATLITIHFARDVVMPIVVAIILTFVFSPVVRALKRYFIPAPLTAGIIVIGLLVGFLACVYNLAEPAGAWLAKAPQSLREIETKLHHIAGGVHDVAAATAKVQTMTEQMAGGDASGKKPQQVVVQAPTLAAEVVTRVRGFAVACASAIVLLYFLLASGDIFLRKTIAATKRLSDKKRAIDIARQVESAVSNYLLTVTLINAGLGLAVGVTMFFLGMPNPVLWGVMVGLFNFVPYLGELTSLTILTIVGLLTFDDLWHSFAAPVLFYLLSALEGYLVTPLILGRQLSLNPVVIVICVLFWGFMWGIPGMLLAVPILVAAKTLCDRVESLQVLGDFMGA
jgi:predicted PurR-regulated permease PerM